MQIYLYGIHGVYNYGCDAMVRGISAQLKKMYPESCIKYVSYNYDMDMKYLADCGTVEVHKVEDKYSKKIQKCIFARGIRFIKKKIGIAKPESYVPGNTDWMKNCDLLVIIGGDVFDLLPHQYGNKPYRNERIYASRAVKKYGGKVALWGISIGSFEKNLVAKKTLIDYFKNDVDIAIIRDKKSFNYLKDNGVEKICFVADPAYIMRSTQTEKKNDGERVLGINLSPLANRYLKIEKTEEEWIDGWSGVIEKIFNQLEFDKIILIPHVVNPNNKRDDDYSYLEQIYKKLQQKGIKSELAPGNMGFVKIKETLVKCDLILAARMHCAVNSVTCGVPAVFLSYSLKSMGMCEYVYGDTDMFVDMNELFQNSEDIIGRLREISNHLDEKQLFLKSKNFELYEQACSAVKYIDMCLKG